MTERLLALVIALSGRLQYACVARKGKNEKRSDRRGNKGRNLLSYMIFVLSPVFSYGMLWFDRDAYVQYLVEKGTEQTYMDTMVSTAQNWMLPAMIIGVLICAAISGLVGQKLLKKHFEKAGVV